MSGIQGEGANYLMDATVPADKWRVSPHIKMLSRGRERILFNPQHVNPAYFAAGGDDVSRLLSQLKRMEPFGYPPESLCPSSLFDFLRDHGLVIQDGADERVHRMCGSCPDGRFPKELSAYLLLSQSCNLACIYCLNGRKTYHASGKTMMPLETALKAVNELADKVSPDGRLSLILFGGEPLLNWSLAKQLIHYCEYTLKPERPALTVNYHITTNLSILPDDFIELCQNVGMTVLVDIDGPEETHNFLRPMRNGYSSYAATSKNIETLVNAGINVDLRATVTSHNQHHMVEIARIHRQLGGSGCAFVPLNAVDSDGNIFTAKMCPSPKIYSEGLLEVYDSGIWPLERLFPFNEFSRRLIPGYQNRLACGAPSGCTPVVSTEGKIFSCIYLVNNPIYEIGDLDLNDYPRRDTLQRMKAIVDIDSRRQCRNCAYRYLCGGGCPVGILAIANNPQAPEYVKRYTEEIACATAKTCLNALFWKLGSEIGLSLTSNQFTATRLTTCL